MSFKILPRRKPVILFGVTSDRSVRLLKELPQLLVEEGWEVHLVSSPGPGLGSYRTKAGITTHSLEMARKPDLIADLFSMVKWLTILRKVRPDAVSIGTPKAGLLGIVASHIARVPRRIYHLRGLRLETLHGAPRLAAILIEKLIMWSATEILAISPSLRQAVIDMRLAPAPKIHLAGAGSSSGVDLQRFNLNKRGSIELEALKEELNISLNSNLPTIGYVGRIHADKGIDTLIQASRMLHRQNIEHQLLLVGSAEDSSLLAAVRNHGEIVPVVVVDRVENIAPYYHLMSCLVLPTRREGFGNVSIEAQASGIPVITTNATGAIDTVQENVGGIIVPVDDYAALAEAIRDLLLNQNIFEAPKIRQSVLKFDKDNIIPELIEYYNAKSQ